MPPRCPGQPPAAPGPPRRTPTLRSCSRGARGPAAPRLARGKGCQNLFKPRFKLNAEATAPGTTGPRPAERLACVCCRTGARASACKTLASRGHSLQAAALQFSQRFSFVEQRITHFRPAPQRTGRARHARTHTCLKHNTALWLVGQNHSRRAPRDTCTAPRNNRPATYRCLAGLHKRTSHTAPAPSGSTGRRRVTPGRRASLPPPHLHHRQARASDDGPTVHAHGAPSTTKPRRMGLSTFSQTGVGRKPGRRPIYK